MIAPPAFLDELKLRWGAAAEERVALWCERVRAELAAGRRVSLPSLGTLRPRGTRHGRSVVVFTLAPELKRAFELDPGTDGELQPSPEWVRALPDLHGEIARVMIERRYVEVALEGLGSFVCNAVPRPAGQAPVRFVSA